MTVVIVGGGPAGPVAPVGPAGSVAPVAPSGPVAPPGSAGPVTPAVPADPHGPSDPNSPSPKTNTDMLCLLFRRAQAYRKLYLKRKKGDGCAVVPTCHMYSWATGEIYDEPPAFLTVGFLYSFGCVRHGRCNGCVLLALEPLAALLQ